MTRLTAASALATLLLACSSETSVSAPDTGDGIDAVAERELAESTLVRLSARSGRTQGRPEAGAVTVDANFARATGIDAAASVASLGDRPPRTGAEGCVWLGTPAGVRPGAELELLDAGVIRVSQSDAAVALSPRRISAWIPGVRGVLYGTDSGSALTWREGDRVTVEASGASSPFVSRFDMPGAIALAAVNDTPVGTASRIVVPASTGLRVRVAATEEYELVVRSAERPDGPQVSCVRADGLPIEVGGSWIEGLGGDRSPLEVVVRTWRVAEPVEGASGGRQWFEVWDRIEVERAGTAAAAGR